MRDRRGVGDREMDNTGHISTASRGAKYTKLRAQAEEVKKGRGWAGREGKVLWEDTSRG